MRGGVEAAIVDQRFVGTGYFDEVAKPIASGKLSTQSLKCSTEQVQFHAR